MEEYRIKLDRNVLKQLGSQLYGDTPSIIAELVANSYDADATNVWISIDTKENSIVVEDDGKGMTAKDINNSFLNIGYDKRDSEHTTLGRKIMGRKGIGKLAAFSLTNCVRVLSSKDNKKCGCSMDFKKIIAQGEPEAVSPDTISFSKDRLSKNGTGTRIELNNVKKRVALSYRFIVNKLIRTFDVNDEEFTIHIRKNDAEFKSLKRSSLDYFSIMDTILVIGEEHYDKLEKVLHNTIEPDYKRCLTYDEYVNSQKPRAKNKLKQFPYDVRVEDSNGEETTVPFSINGWIGTVSALPELKKVAQAIVSEDGADQDDKADQEEEITLSDNRISLFARGKLGEYDILSKVKNNRNSEAYVIGEIFADIFEDDSLADMAISNRRGYDESDNRYIETVKTVKRLLRYIVDLKDEVSKKQKEDAEKQENDRIRDIIIHRNKSREIFEKKLTQDERSVVQEENYQFTRAITSSKTNKKIFISHNSKLKEYGQFIVDVLEEYGVDVKSSIIFTSDPRLGVPQGRDIYDYLKDCFREELMVIFIFGKSFYDSNVCISEAGAAWATNQNCLNAIVDIGFCDIEKPSNNSLSSIKLRDLHDPGQSFKLYEFFTTIISVGLNLSVDSNKLTQCIQHQIDCAKYNDAIMNYPPLFWPKRKFLPKLICSSCGNKMEIAEKDGVLVYKCQNVSCTSTIDLIIE